MPINRVDATLVSMHERQNKLRQRCLTLVDYHAEGSGPAKTILRNMCKSDVAAGRGGDDEQFARRCRTALKLRHEIVPMAR